MDNWPASEEPAPSPQDNLQINGHHNHNGHCDESPPTMANLSPIHAQESSCAIDSKWRELV